MARAFAQVKLRNMWFRWLQTPLEEKASGGTQLAQELALFSFVFSTLLHGPLFPEVSCVKPSFVPSSLVDRDVIANRGHISSELNKRLTASTEAR